MYGGYSTDGQQQQQQQQLRRDNNHAIAVHEKRIVHQSPGGNQRYSPREGGGGGGGGGQSNGGNGSTASGGRSYQHGSSPVLVATSCEDYENGGAIVSHASGPTVGVQLDSPAPSSYSPPIAADGGIRSTTVVANQQHSAQQQQQQQQPQQIITGYVNATGGGVSIKYETETTNAAVAAAAAAAVAAAVPVDGIKVSSTYTTLETVSIPQSQTVQYHQYISGSDTFQQASTYTYTKPGEQVILAYPSPGQLSTRVTGVSSES